MKDTILPAALPHTRTFCCQMQARMQAAHDAAFDVWLHAKSWRAARRSAQKLNATALQIRSHMCDQTTKNHSDGAEQAGSQAFDDSTVPPHNSSISGNSTALSPDSSNKTDSKP